MTTHSRQADFSSLTGLGGGIVAPQSPLLARRDHDHPSVFLPEVLLHEARKQKGLDDTPVPPVCLLDSDGDIAVYVRRELGARKSPSWACFHTELWEWEDRGQRFGIVGRAVGAPFAVLIAEQLFVSGCELLISIASAGAIADDLPHPSYVLIEQALRDEGTSYHYLPSAPYVFADAGLFAKALRATAAQGLPVMRGASWTTDAPFRETAATVLERRKQGIHAVEMEAAALLAFAQARRKPLIAIAHITNAPGQGRGDFDKGADHGAETALAIASAIAGSLLEKPGFCRDAGPASVLAHL
jgi:uridine phosphorylase